MTRLIGTARGGVLLAAFAVLAGAQHAATAPQAPAPPSFADAIAAVRPALVRLAVVFSDTDGGREVRREASGSGFIITPDGHVLTNHHVAGRASRVRATLADGRQLDADLVGSDPLADLAVVKLRGNGTTPFATASFGDSSALALGEPVLAMGSPLGLSQSVTAGIVSNLALVMPREVQLDGEDIGTLVGWIGHDAPIFPGNSGGPLVNLRGEVIGVNDIGFGLGGAIPGNLAREVAEALVRDGRVRRAWMGLELQPLVDGTAATAGALVGSVLEGSPAARAGVVAGDVLLAAGGAAVLARTPEDLAPLNLRLARLPIGSPIDLTVRRDTRELTVSVTPVEREPRRARAEEVTSLGFTGSNLTSWRARELRREDTAGVEVTGVRPGGSLDAARPKLQAGDVIVAVDGTRVDSLDALRARLAAHRQNAAGGQPPAALLVAFERSGERLATLVEPATRESADRSTDAARAWLPATTQPLPPALADRLGMPGVQGAFVTRVYPGEAGAAADLRVGDVVVAFDDEPVAAPRGQDADPVAALARQRRIGSVVPVRIWREGREHTLEVTLAAAPPSARDAPRYRDALFEFTARDLVLYDDEPAGGVKVDEVTEGGWAALARLRPGDVVLSVDGTATGDVAALERAMATVAGARPDRVVLLVRRGVATRFLDVRPAWTPNDRP